MSHITTEPIDYFAVTESVRTNAAGAVVNFLGTVRDLHEGKEVKHLDYEAYGSMAEKKLAEIESNVQTKWPDTKCSIIHRTGHLGLNEISVVIAVASPHRAEAFEACRHAIEAIKVEVPIWKKETFADGTVEWVDPTAKK